MVSLEFFIHIILPTALLSWGWLSLQQKWVPGLFPEGLIQLMQRTGNLTTFICWFSWKLGTQIWSYKGLFRPVAWLLYMHVICYKSVILNALFISVLFVMLVVQNVEKVCHFLPLISQSLMRSVCKRFLRQVYFHTCSALWIFFYQLMMLYNSNIVLKWR
jgi:hypothetical protein